jgi:hypothetical protein
VTYDVTDHASSLWRGKACNSRGATSWFAIAPNGPGRVKLLREFAQDKLVPKSDLPGDSGNKLLGLIRKTRRLRVFPVVLTRWDHKVSQYPVREYYVQPFSTSQLATAIDTAVNPHEPRDSSYRGAFIGGVRVHSWLGDSLRRSQ